MIRAVLFDMDGTVIDSVSIYNRGWIYAAEKAGFSGEEIIPLTDRFSGMNGADLVRFLQERFGEEYPAREILDGRDRFVSEEIKERGVPPKPGVPEVFERLSEMGIRSALVTGSRRSRVELILSVTGLGTYFESVVTGDDIQKSKPSPDCFLYAAKLLGLSPAECAVAEDAPGGVQAGYAAGMPVAMIPDFCPFTDDLAPMVRWHLTSLAELPDAIAAANAAEARQ